MYIVVDVETGGLNPEEHALLTVAAVPIWKTDTNELHIGHPWYAELQPAGAVTVSALQINNINLDVHMRTARRLDEAHADFCNWLTNLRTSSIMHDKAEKFTLVGWNVRFDASFLQPWFQACNDDLEHWFSYRMLDIQAIVSFLIEKGDIPTSARGGLRGIAAHLNIPYTNPHHALADAFAVVSVLTHLWRNVTYAVR